MLCAEVCISNHSTCNMHVVYVHDAPKTGYIVAKHKAIASTDLFGYTANNSKSVSDLLWSYISVS